MFKRKKQVAPKESTRRSPNGTSPQVFSYYARSSSSTGQNVGRTVEREEARPERRLPKIRFGGIPSLVALFAMLGIFVYSMWIQPSPKVVVLAKSGTVYQDSSAYQKAIAGAWSSHLGNQFKMSVNASALEKQIQTAVPDVASVQVQLPLLGRRPTVVLTPGTPALELVTANGGFFVDKNGKVLARSSEVKQNQLQNVPTVQDESGIKAEPGKTILTIEQATFIRTLAQQLAAEGLNVQSMILPSNAANQVDVRLKGQNYYIKFATTGEVRQSVGTYLAARNKLNAEGITPAEYVDVRIDEKVFYK